MQGFMEFVRKQGVVGMAVGIAVGGAVATFVGDFITGIVSPLIGAITGGEEGLSDLTNEVAGVSMNWGLAVSSFITFLATALVVYMMVRMIGADKWDLDDE